jgi:hypothetical protein
MRIGFPGTGTAGRHLRPEVAGPEVPPEPDMMDKDTAELAYRQGAAAVAPGDRRADGLGHRRGVRRFVRAARRC